MKPIRVFQCQDDCCLVQVPSKRFWYIDAPHALRFGWLIQGCC